MNTPKNARRRVIDARAALVLDHAFFGALSLRLEIVEETQGLTRTMLTDGRSVFFNREYVQTCSDGELVGLWARLVMRPALQHHTRRGDRDPALWNDAGEYAINPLLLEASFSLPGRPLMDPQFRGMTAEQIYDVLDQESNGDGKDDREDDVRTSGDQTKDTDGTGSDDEGANANDRDKDNGNVPSNALANKPGAVIDAPDPARQEAEWQVALKQASQAAQMMGQLPGGIALAVAEAMRPRIDWKSITRRFAQELATADYSWRTPNPRYIAGGFCLPVLRSEGMGILVVVIDSSGSTVHVLPVFKAELQSIVDECQPERTIVIMVDAEVQRVDVFERGEPIEFNVVGFGGTDFRPAFDYVEREQINPCGLIYLTDGYGYFPDDPPSYPVLWAITSQGITAPSGETVFVDVSTS
jgi:predicted metal-dependent peptidase